MPRTPEHISKPENIESTTDSFKTAEQQLLSAIFGDSEVPDLGDVQRKEVEQVSHRILREQVDHVLANLTDREHKVLILRFGLEDGRSRTLKEAGEAIGRSARTAGRVEKSGLQKLRKPSAEKKKLKDYLA